MPWQRDVGRCEHDVEDVGLDVGWDFTDHDLTEHSRVLRLGIDDVVLPATRAGDVGKWLRLFDIVDVGCYTGFAVNIDCPMVCSMLKF